MHKSFTLKKIQDKTTNPKVRKGINSYRPSNESIAFIMAYAAAFSVIKTKIGNTHVLLN
jgi:hypothetical protein